MADKEIEFNPDSYNENSVEWIRGSKTLTATFSQKKFINLARKYAREHPEEVEVIENKDGMVLVHAPLSYFKFSPPRQMSDEQRQKSSERMKQLHKNSII